MYAELWIRIEKQPFLVEEKVMDKWKQLIKSFQAKGIDVDEDTPSFTSVDGDPKKEIRIGLGSGKKTEEPNYDAMYQLIGKFVQFLYEEVLHNGPLNIKLYRTGASG